MRKLYIGALLLPALLLLGAVPVSAADQVEVMVMSHYCKADIQSEADFQAVEAKGKGNPVAALAQTVLACPTSVNSGDATSNGVKDQARAFSFTISDGSTSVEMPNASTPAKLCESDIKLDANGDGKISKDVCLDISHYAFDPVSSDQVTVTEHPASGFRFGTLRFTPPVIDKNNDEESLASSRDGVIRLSAAGDNDGKIMLHVYNFSSRMPDSSTATPAAPTTPSAPLAPLALVAGVAGVLAGSLVVRRVTSTLDG